MSRIAYVSGAYVDLDDAVVHVEDRGYQFGDAVYEVCPVYNRVIGDFAEHMERLQRSLAEIGMTMPMAATALHLVARETVRRNRIGDGILYIQVSRGRAPRNHLMPAHPRPVLVMTARRLDWGRLDRLTETGVAVITVPDMRWRRCDIKSVNLLGNVLAKQQAHDAGAFEAWQVDEQGLVTEGSSTNAWIIDRAGDLISRPLDHAILRGITRQTVIALAERQGCKVIERPFSPAEAIAAREAFLTSTTSMVLPVVTIDGKPVGDGAVGPVSRELYAMFCRRTGRLG